MPAPPAAWIQRFSLLECRLGAGIAPDDAGISATALAVLRG